MIKLNWFIKNIIISLNLILYADSSNNDLIWP
jgi:hypothetical protein